MSRHKTARESKQKRRGSPCHPAAHIGTSHAVSILEPERLVLSAPAAWPGRNNHARGAARPVRCLALAFSAAGTISGTVTEPPAFSTASRAEAETPATVKFSAEVSSPLPSRRTPSLPPRARPAAFSAAPLRFDHALTEGTEVSPYYDAMLGKLIVHGRDRTEALARLNRALNELIVDGVDTTVPLFRELLKDPDIQSGNYSIHWLERWLERNYH